MPPAPTPRYWPRSRSRRANIITAPARSFAGTSSRAMNPRSTRTAQPVARPSWPGNHVPRVPWPQPHAQATIGLARRPALGIAGSESIAARRVVVVAPLLLRVSLAM